MKLIFAFGALAIVSLYIWPYSLGHDKFSLRFKYLLAFLYLTAIFFSFVSFSDGWLVRNVYSSTNVVLGEFFHFYAIYLTILIIGLLFFIFYAYKHADFSLKQKILLSVIGFSLFILTLLTVSLILPSFGYYDLAILDSSCTLIFIGFTGYAIVSKELFDTKVLLTEAAVFIVMIALFLLLISSQNPQDWILRGIIFLLSVYGGYLIIKSVHVEINKNEQLKDLTQQLAQANAHLQDLDKMKTEFVSLASHELLTPVSAIEGYLSMILDEKIVPVADLKLKEYLDRVYGSAKRLARLIADMLNISRIEEGRLLVEKKETDLGELVKDVIAELKFKSEERQQKIVFDTPETFQSFADPDKIKEIIINLVGNSIKYSAKPGTIHIGIQAVPTQTVKDFWDKMEAEAKKRPLDEQEAISSTVNGFYRQFVGDEQYLIQVKDEGIGIPKEELPKLFKKFHRVGDFTTAESQGTGLGLYISKALVELHHGRIWVDSKGHDKGSTFTFTLPLLKAKEEIIKVEDNIPKKGDMKPLAKPMTAAEEI